jgi:riboflavin kinase/FMN adenylyltransferase
MEIFTQITNLTRDYPRIAVALGTFDGVHLGHQKIISRAVELARLTAGASVVFTFLNHPLAAVAPERCPLQIDSPDFKAKLIENLGVDVLMTIPFTKQFARLSPTEFLTVLTDNLNPKHVVIGPNYSFGYKGAGTPEFFIEEGTRRGFAVEILDALEVDGTIVSSTLIRHMLGSGNVAGAARLLGRPARISGTVVTGDQRGRTLGYPTANLPLEPGMAAPGNGVYAVSVDIGAAKYGGIANIGTNPTFKRIKRHLEVYLFNFSGILYGKKIAVDFIERLRSEKAFSGSAELKAQIQQDICQAKKYLTGKI